jgi:hypothetical protein
MSIFEWLNRLNLLSHFLLSFNSLIIDVLINLGYLLNVPSVESQEEC